MYILGYFSWCICAWISRSGILGSWVYTFSILVRNDKLCCKVVVETIESSISSIKFMLFPHPHQHVMLPDFNLHDGYDVLSHCSLNLHFIVSNVEHLFICSFPFVIIYLQISYSKSCPFIEFLNLFLIDLQEGGFCFVLLKFISDINLLSVLCVKNLFFQFVYFFF